MSISWLQCVWRLHDAKNRALIPSDHPSPLDSPRCCRCGVGELHLWHGTPAGLYQVSWELKIDNDNKKNDDNDNDETAMVNWDDFCIALHEDLLYQPSDHMRKRNPIWKADNTTWCKIGRGKRLSHCGRRKNPNHFGSHHNLL